MTKNLLLFCVLLLFTASLSEAQRRRPPGPERVEKYKKMELLDALNLDEEKAVRFSVRLDAHEDTMKKLREARKETVNELEALLEKHAEPKEYEKIIDKVYENDQNMFSERKRFLDEMRTFLTPEQFAKFFVFERDFEMRLRKAMRELRRERFERKLD